jgi:hypothetical protein
MRCASGTGEKFGAFSTKIVCPVQSSKTILATKSISASPAANADQQRPSDRDRFKISTAK